MGRALGELEDEPTPERGGRRRKYYTLRPEGALELSRSVDVIRTMSEGLLPKLEAMSGSERG